MNPHPNHCRSIPVVEMDLLEVAHLIETANDTARRLSVLFAVISEKTQGNLEAACLSSIGRELAEQLSNILDDRGERCMLKYFNPPAVVH